MDRHVTTRPRHLNHRRVGSGSREDCWTEDATETLIEAWGDRYLKLNKGNLRQKDWKDVADAVNNCNSENDVVKPKSDVQCKNRIDTLKKKYKHEKASTTPSKWPFYRRLDSLIGSNAAVNKKPTVVTFTVKSSSSTPNSNPSRILYSGESKSKSKSAETLSGDDDDDDRTVGKEAVELSDEGVAWRELARVMVRFGEIYERIERSKQQQMMELERERMEFTKDLEFRRLNMFVDAQLQVEKKSKRENNRAKSKSG